MGSDVSSDDSFMHLLALDLLRKHEKATEAQGPKTSGPVGEIDDTLMAALMATRHIVVWHVGSEPSPEQIAAFARKFPDWTLIDEACMGQLGASQGALQTADCPRPDTDLVLVCRRFLTAYAYQYLGEAGSMAKEPAQALRARLASGNKRH